MSTRLDDYVTLGEARQWLRDRVAKGAECPCCTQYAKIYRRKLNSGMAISLIRMYRAGGTGWVDVTIEIPARHREEGKLRYWDLVEPGTTRGVWKVTPKGEEFVKEEIKVPSHVDIYDDKMLRLVGDPIGIRDALGSKFDYEELMSTPGSAATGAGPGVGI
jgi:hypothetical protein